MPVSFAQGIAPLFRPEDLTCMKGFGVQLDDYAYMSDPDADSTYADHANARNVYAHLTGTTPPQMPMGGPYWSKDQLDLFEQWMTDGFLA
jgi:hypothetical protein